MVALPINSNSLNLPSQCAATIRAAAAELNAFASLARPLAECHRSGVEKASGAQLVNARQLVQTFQTEMHEKARASLPKAADGLG